MAKRNILARISTAVTSRSWDGYSVPDPLHPADYGPGASMRRADRYTGHGQPRQLPDPQQAGVRQSVAVVTAQERPLAVASPAGGVPAVIVDHRAPDPVGTATVLSIQAMYGLGQAGQLGNIRWGLPGMPRDGVFDGDLGKLQALYGAQGVAQDLTNVTPARNRSTYRGGILSGLPSSSGVASMPLSDVQAALIQTSGYWG